MSVTIDGTTFDNVYYDAVADVLYLHVGDPSNAVDFDESPEGHALRYDANGRLVGITIIGAKYFLEKDGRIDITIPEHVATLDPHALERALAAA
jgi:uncharacterized protein YuzE